MVNPDVDGFTETLNHRKILRKTQKNKLLKTKRILSGGPVFTISLTGKGVSPSSLVSYAIERVQ